MNPEPGRQRGGPGDSAVPSRGERSGGSELRLREGCGDRARSRRGSDLISRVGLCYRLCAARSGPVMRDAGFREGWGPFRTITFGWRRRLCRAVRSRRNSSAKTRTAAAKPDRIVRLVLSASLHLYLCQLCRVRLILEQEEFLLQAISGTVGCFLSEGEFPKHQKRGPQHLLICRCL